MTQAQALTILKSGANVFLTGEPGSGKSHTVNQYVTYLREHDIEPAITASTGIAATHIGGMTIHSWSGIGIKKELTDQDLDNLTTNERISKRLERATVLIIDEISMLDAKTLSAVDSALRAVRRRPTEAFGGLQTVFVGDFFQLPPVSRGTEEKPDFAFASHAWRSAKPLVCYLTEQHRQEDDRFLALLASIRNATFDEDIHDILSSRQADEMEDVDHMTRLYSHNIDVDRINNERLSAIDEEERIYEMDSRGAEGLIVNLKKGCLSPESLCLKIGAQVMFTKNNFEQHVANGTLGEVIGFSVDGAPIVETKDGRRIEVAPAEWSVQDGMKTLATIIQYPLRLAWAITIHKSQGMTLDSAIMDLSETFEYGQGYVALSRVKSFGGLHLLGYNTRALQVHPQIKKIDEKFKEESDEAHEVFSNMSAKELEKLSRNFIVACGGSLDKVEPKKKKGIAAKGAPKQSTHDITLGLLSQDKTLKEICSERGITLGTVIGHVEELFIKGKLEKMEIENIVHAQLSDDAIDEIVAMAKKLDTDKLAPIFGKLKGKYTYEQIRLGRMMI